MPILIADDDSISHQTLQFQLEQWGHSVLTAADGDEAWQLFQRHDCSIVITDWMMPRMPGINLIQKIRDAEQTQYTYVILLTSKSQKSDLIAGLASGADDFLVKPVDPHELKARLQTGLRISRLRQCGTGGPLGDSASRKQAAALLEQLTDREMQILRAVVAGKPNKQIAKELDLSVKTIEAHRSRLMRKLQARGIADLVRVALAAGDNL
jgi:sigma-B regulation protein RsbU (phosphoserine phosphatase)